MKKDEKKPAVNKPKKKSQKEIDAELFSKPLDQLTEEEIIRKGLKTKNKSDIYCYIGMFLLFVLIIIPPIFNVVFDYTRPKDTHEDVVYSKLSCKKVYSGKSALTLTVQNQYRNSVVESSVLEYVYTDVEGETVNTSEIEKWLNYESEPGITIKQTDELPKHSTRVVIDYLNHSELKHNEGLKDYAMSFMPQLNYYGDQGFYCTKESKTVVEDTAHPEERKDPWKEEEEQ